MPRLPHLQEDSTEEHRRILNAIEMGDADAASAASEDHIRHLTVRFATA
jgi:DNA-binding FadR family transcriptional regulator